MLLGAFTNHCQSSGGYLATKQALARNMEIQCVTLPLLDLQRPVSTAAFRSDKVLKPFFSRTAACSKCLGLHQESGIIVLFLFLLAWEHPEISKVELKYTEEFICFNKWPKSGFLPSMASLADI